MDYTVRVVDDCKLDLDWVLVEEPDGYLFILRRSALGPRAMAEGWAAFALLDHAARRVAV